jgi:hypothetical protein
VNPLPKTGGSIIARAVHLLSPVPLRRLSPKPSSRRSTRPSRGARRPAAHQLDSSVPCGSRTPTRAPASATILGLLSADKSWAHHPRYGRRVAQLHIKAGMGDDDRSGGDLERDFCSFQREQHIPARSACIAAASDIWPRISKVAGPFEKGFIPLVPRASYSACYAARPIIRPTTAADRKAAPRAARGLPRSHQQIWIRRRPDARRKLP